MPLLLSQADYWDQLRSTSVRAPDPLESCWKLPRHWGEGTLREIKVRDGLFIDWADYRLHQPLTLLAEDREHPFEWVFGLGETDWLDPGTYLSAGEHAFFGAGMAPSGSLEGLAHKRFVSMSIHIQPDLVCQWLGQSLDQARAEMEFLFRSEDQPYFEYQQKTPIEMKRVVQQIRSCPYQNQIRRMYLESKIWELMAMQLDHLFNHQGEKDKCTARKLAHDDIDRIYTAQEILIRQLQNPPSLVELARQVGLNDYKLKIGFHQVFETTVFGYLHQKRMERAQHLLETGDISVSGAAHAVGYASLSHFTAAFRRQFGVNPCVYRRLNQEH
jgi:AraC-like DNA-binding protein